MLVLTLRQMEQFPADRVRARFERLGILVDSLKGRPHTKLSIALPTALGLRLASSTHFDRLEPHAKMRYT